MKRIVKRNYETQFRGESSKSSEIIEIELLKTDLAARN